MRLSGCDWVFQSKKVSSDYHDEMNATSFEEWVNEKLLPALPPNTIIVMDNASYHRYWDDTTGGQTTIAIAIMFFR